jgi:hypothetical protein
VKIQIEQANASLVRQQTQDMTDLRNILKNLIELYWDGAVETMSNTIAKIKEQLFVMNLAMKVALAQLIALMDLLKYMQTAPLTWLKNLIDTLLGTLTQLLTQLSSIIPPTIITMLNLAKAMFNLWWYWFNYPYYIMIAFWNGIEAGFNMQGYTIIPVCTVHPDPWCSFYYAVQMLNAVASQTFLLPFFLVGMLVVTLYVLQKNVEELWNAL